MKKQRYMSSLLSAALKNVLILSTLWATGAATLSAAAAPPQLRRARPPVPLAPVQPTTCPLGALEGVPGSRKVALMVGVGDYLSERIPDLKGPANDVAHLRALLTRSDGFGFPAQNICTLINQEATVQGFERTFQKALVERVKPGDSVVIFFGGHGSQTKDLNEDEPDEKDETLVFYDSRVNGQRDLNDDTLNALLRQLHAITPNITVILDSCNSGSATREIVDVRAIPEETSTEQGGDARVVGPSYPDNELPGVSETPTSEPNVSESNASELNATVSNSPESRLAFEDNGDGATGVASVDLPGIVVMSAASDGTTAKERDGEGLFTNALLSVLAEGSHAPLTVSQVAYRVRQRLSPVIQIPYFEGALNSPVFGVSTALHAIGWSVSGVMGERVVLSGPPLPGWSKNAEIRIFPGESTSTERLDPANALATALLSQVDGLKGTATLFKAGRPSRPVQPGDLALLVRPGDDAVVLPVKFVPEGSPGGVPNARRSAIEKAVGADDTASRVVRFSSDASALFAIQMAANGTLQLVGPEGTIRNTFQQGPREALNVTRALWLHARQRALLPLGGNGGTSLEDGKSLEVRIVPHAAQNTCAANTRFIQAPANSLQRMPVCMKWDLEVTLAKDALKPLLVGGFVLSNEGSIYGFPRYGLSIKLEPGRPYRFPLAAQATPPLEVLEHVLVFGTPESEPVPWSLFTEKFSEQKLASTALTNLLKDYVTGSRGQVIPDASEDSRAEWTVSHVPVIVEANAGFQTPREPMDTNSLSREYTLANFDLRPYLPDSPTSALRRVLELAESLVEAEVPYKQHDWSQASDQANLRLGMDCSRAMWYLFTRSGLNYNDSNAYVTTSGMASRQSSLATEFDRCDRDSTLQTGDVLVYRDQTRNIGHTVMVIDPQKRIAWGSHAWDGNSKLTGNSDRGLEFQRIKYKQDWNLWDSPSVKRVACWRHRQFSLEAKSPLGRPGVEALKDVCSQRSCGEQQSYSAPQASTPARPAP